MIGFDRPIKSEWIYEILKIIEIGDKPNKYNETFELIAKELVGKEGKRKARTIIYRSFIYCFQNSRSKIENNILIKLTKEKSLDYLTPLYLSQLIMTHDVLIFIINKLRLSFTTNSTFSSSLLTTKMVSEYGDRDIVRRSVRAFLKTLEYYKLIERINLQDFRILKYYDLNEEQIKDFILSYSKSYLKSNFVNLNEINQNILYFFNEFDIIKTAKKYHSEYWEYVRDGHRNILLIKNN